MSIYYLWNTSIPNRLNYNMPPEEFFESILYKRDAKSGDRDRFSHIQDNYLELQNSLQGITPHDIGFEYVGYRIAENSTEVIGQVVYVKPGTDAETVGVMRGDYFTQVNGTALDTINWRKLLSDSKTSVTITFFNSATMQFVDKTVRKFAYYAEDPVFFDKVYEVNGRKIGYLVYNFFAPGPNNRYDRKLNNVFGSFKSKGITDLVLDLRYNNGGYMSSAILLGSMIVPDLNAGNVFIKTEFNSLLQAAYINEFGEDALIDRFIERLNAVELVNNVGGTIQSLYVLTSRWTASASELIINGLKPYMQVFLIGNTTVGKNVGSILIYEDDDAKNKWGMLPIVLRYYNRDGNADFADGFAPDILEHDNGAKLPLGDMNEEMLKIAIDHITGRYVPKTSVRSGVGERVTLGSSIEQKAWAEKVIVGDSILKKLNIK